MAIAVMKRDDALFGPSRGDVRYDYITPRATGIERAAGSIQEHFDAAIRSVFLLGVSVLFLSRNLYVQLLMQSVIRLPLSRAPGPGLIDEPVFLNCRPADLSSRATLLDNLELAVPGFLVSIFNPEPRAIYDIG